MIRDEKKFDNEEELIRQIKDDVAKARDVLGVKAMSDKP